MPRQRVAARLATLPEAERQGAAETLRAEGRQRKSRQPVAGFDFTFSLPKSVSTRWAVADAGTAAVIVQAHHAAMHDVLGFMAARWPQPVSARRGAPLGVRGLIVTSYDHYDLRAGDP